MSEEFSVSRQPVRTASGITAVAAVLMTAFFLIARDFGVSVPEDTQAAVTAALVALVALVANEWARRQVTPTAHPHTADGREATLVPTNEVTQPED